MKKLLLALIASVSAATLLTGCSKTDNKVTTTNSNGQTETKEAKDVTVKIGDTFDFGDYTFKTANLREVKPEYSTDTYTILDMTITAKNDGKMFTGQVQGVTSENAVVNNTFVGDTKLGDPIITAFTKNLSKGQSAKGYVAFKKTDNVVKVELSSNALSKDKVTITLS